MQHALNFCCVMVMGRDLVATDGGTKVTMMPGATFIPSVRALGVANTQELIVNRASTRAYAVAADPQTNQALVVAFNIDSGTSKLLNSVRCWPGRCPWMPAI